MRKFYYILLIFIGLSVTAYTQENETTVQDMLKSANEKVLQLEKSGQEVVNMTIDLVNGENTKSIYRYLDPTFTYTLMVISDNRIDNINLTVKKAGRESWELVSQNSGSNPSVSVAPTEPVEYQFNINVTKWKASNSAGHFALILYHIDPEKQK